MGETSCTLERENLMKTFIFTVLMFCALLILLTNCPQPDPDDGESTPEPTSTPTPETFESALFTFENDTDIAAWISDGAVYTEGEGGATGGSCALSVEQAYAGTQSLKIEGTLGTAQYTSHSVRINLLDTTGLSAQDFSSALVTVSVYVPPAPAGGGDYIQVVLLNNNGDNVQSGAYSITFSAWNTISFDLGAYVSGAESWGYDSTGGSPGTVYEAVTEVGV